MCNRDARCNCHCDSEWKIGDKVTNHALYDKSLGVIIAIGCKKVKIKYEDGNSSWWCKANLFKISTTSKQEYMQVGKKYKSDSSGIIVTCVGYDEEVNKYIVKLSNGNYDKQKGCLTYTSGKTCWYEYKEPVVEYKYGLIHKGESTHWFKQLNNPNVKATFTDGVLTNIELLS